MNDRDSGVINNEEGNLSRSSRTTNRSRKESSCCVILRNRREILKEWWNNLTTKTGFCADLGDNGGHHEAVGAVHAPNSKINTLICSSSVHCLLTKIHSSSFAGPMNYRAFSVLSATHKTLPPITFMNFRSIMILKNYLPSKRRLTSEYIFTIAQKQVFTASHLISGNMALRCYHHDSRSSGLLLVGGWLPHGLRVAVIITIHKNKGEISDCPINRVPPYFSSLSKYSQRPFQQARTNHG